MRAPRQRGAATTALVAVALLIAGLLLAGCGGDDEPEQTAPDIASVPHVGDGDEPRFGYNEPFEADAPDIPLIGKSGSDTARRLIAWRSVEPVEGERRWDSFDRLYDQLLEQGVRPLWIPVGAPCWASVNPGNCTENSGALAPSVERKREFADFLAELVERYPESLGVEVGNEPNLNRYWRGGLDAADYTEILGASADAVHEVDPEMPVVAGGLAPIFKAVPGKLPWADYINAIYDAGVDEKIDAIGFHPYVGISPSEEPLPVLNRLINQFEGVLDRNGGEDMPVWVTEIGITTVGQFAVPPEQQASELVTLYEALAERDIPVVIVHRFNDDETPSFPGDAGFGVIEADQTTPKPAFCALAEVRGVSCE